jgi:hypothetical protein
MQSSDPALARASEVQRELTAIPPWQIARLDIGIGDIPAPDPSQRIADDRSLGLELRAVREVLELAPAASISGVMRTGRFHARGRRCFERDQLSPREALRPRQPDARDVTRRRPGDEDDHVVGATDAVASRRDRSDRQRRAGVDHRSASRRAASSH